MTISNAITTYVHYRSALYNLDKRTWQQIECCKPLCTQVIDSYITANVIVMRLCAIQTNKQTHLIVNAPCLVTKKTIFGAGHPSG